MGDEPSASDDQLQDLTGDLTVIEESFGVLAGDDVAPDRGVDDRTRYLDALFDA